MYGLTIFYLTAFVCGAFAFDSDRIVGGKQAFAGQFPHQASLQTRGRKDFCGGVIITNRVVLTAAHCTQGRYSKPYAVKVLVGALRNIDDGDGTLHDVLRIVNHPRYDSQIYDNDISIIQTNWTMIFGRYVRSIRLPSTNLPDENGLALTVTGWGQFRSGKPSSDPADYPDLLQFQHTKNMRLSDCRDRMPREVRSHIFRSTLCIDNPVGQGACVGDSGSGVITDNVVVGIVSWGVHPCGNGMPGVNARVFSFLSFINKTMRALA